MPITDLTNTTWSFTGKLEKGELSSGAHSYYVDFEADINGVSIYTTYTGTIRNRFSMNIANDTVGSFYFPAYTPSYDCRVIDYYYSTSDPIYWRYLTQSTGSYTTLGENAVLTVKFTGGTDATNTEFINWIYANATLISPVMNDYTLTHNLTNVSKGNTKFTITADTGYELPSTVSVSNGTLVSYDSTTGEVVVSGDNAVISAECVASAPSGYNLTINYTGNMNPALRVYVNKTPASFDSTDYDYEFYYNNSPCIVSGLAANDYVYLLGQYGGRYDWTASSNVNCTYVDEEYGRFKVVISSDANASIDIDFTD